MLMESRTVCTWLHDYLIADPCSVDLNVRHLSTGLSVNSLGSGVITPEQSPTKILVH